MAGMKPRHAAALALVVWYLLYPPWSAKQQGVDPSLPLNRWYEVATFDSSPDCEARKFKVLQEMDKQIQEPTPGKLVTTERLRYQAQCASADDPRLKKK
jgi:hypothetical protein